jgi:hypothetical protein
MHLSLPVLLAQFNFTWKYNIFIAIATQLIFILFMTFSPISKASIARSAMKELENIIINSACSQNIDESRVQGEGQKGRKIDVLPHVRRRTCLKVYESRFRD